MSSKFFFVSALILGALVEAKLARAESVVITCPPQIYSTTQYYNLTNEDSAALVIKNINVDNGVLPLDFKKIKTITGIDNDKIHYFCEYGTTSSYSLQVVIKDSMLENCKVEGTGDKATIVCEKNQQLN